MNSRQGLARGLHSSRRSRPGHPCRWVAVRFTHMPNPPAAKQCQDPKSPAFGAVAVTTGDGHWATIHNRGASCWSRDDDVADWADLSAIQR
jgi:hypothetical protein